MNQAADAAREGNLSYFASLDPAELTMFCKKKDDDHRTLLHTACGSGKLDLVQLLAQHSSAQAMNDADEDVGIKRTEYAGYSDVPLTNDTYLGIGA